MSDRFTKKERRAPTLPSPSGPSPTWTEEFVRILQLTFSWNRSAARQSKPRPITTSANKPDRSEILLLEDTWRCLAAEFFPGNFDLLISYTVRWASRPQVTTLASCNVERRRVLVAPAMRMDVCKPHLPALLYHEMCHAVLGIPEVVNGRRRVHTRDFRLLEARHPGIKSMDRWIKCGEWRAAAKLHRRRWNRNARSGSSIR